MKKASGMLSVAKHLLFLVENEQKQIPRSISVESHSASELCHSEEVATATDEESAF
jgi:hypothetical protein